MCQILFNKIKVGVLLGSLILVSSLLLSACSKNDDVCDNAQKGKLVDYTGLDGCGWLIELDNGKRLEPTNLSDFTIDRQDNQKVWISYQAAPSMGSICMVGEMVLIDCIAEH